MYETDCTRDRRLIIGISQTICGVQDVTSHSCQFSHIPARARLPITFEYGTPTSHTHTRALSDKRIISSHTQIQYKHTCWVVSMNTHSQAHALHQYPPSIARYAATFAAVPVQSMSKILLLIARWLARVALRASATRAFHSIKYTKNILHATAA